MTAHFHKKLPPDLQKLSVEQMAKQAREFASGEYLEYLFDGARATEAQREKVLTDFARYTGLSEDLRRWPRSARAAGAVQHRADARSAHDDVAPRFALRRLSTGCRRQQYQLRLQQRQYRGLLPHGLRGLRPQRPELQERQPLLRRGQRAAVVGRIQYRRQPGERRSPRIRTCIFSWAWDITISPARSIRWSGPSPT